MVVGFAWLFKNRLPKKSEKGETTRRKIRTSKCRPSLGLLVSIMIRKNEENFRLRCCCFSLGACAQAVIIRNSPSREGSTL